jgi:hypothetical protein
MDVTMLVVAYIDPSTGGMLFQALAVVAGTVSGTILLFSRKIRLLSGRIRRVFRRTPKIDQGDGEIG